MNTALPHTRTGRIPLPEPPTAVRLAVALLAVALVSGAVEAYVRVAQSTGGVPLAVLDEITPRLVLYGVIGLVVGRFHRGSRWAHGVLLVGIGVVGTASLVIDPVMWLVSGPDVGATVAGLTAADWLVVTARAVHLVAVLVAVALMLHPSTWRFGSQRSKK